MKLLDRDRSTLLSPVGWLNDSIVNAAQKMLKKQFPSINGLQDTALGYVMSYEIQTGQFLQIVHSVDSHWIVVSSIGLQYPDVAVFDSLYESIPLMVKAQIACLVCAQLEDQINVSIMDTQIQVYT